MSDRDQRTGAMAIQAEIDAIESGAPGAAHPAALPFLRAALRVETEGTYQCSWCHGTGLSDAPGEYDWGRCVTCSGTGERRIGRAGHE